MKRLKLNCPQAVVLLVLLGLMPFATGCATAGAAADQLNPYAEGNTVQLGQADNSALLASGGGKNAAQARHALEVLGTRDMRQAPKPYYPVVRPREVRLMWIPDRINRHGDLVPAHYYYLRVMDDRWEHNDAFEVDRQLRANPGRGGGAARGSFSGPRTNYGSGGAGGATPWVYKEE